MRTIEKLGLGLLILVLLCLLVKGCSSKTDFEEKCEELCRSIKSSPELCNETKGIAVCK